MRTMGKLKAGEVASILSHRQKTPALPRKLRAGVEYRNGGSGSA
jgi:hypothetical protein